VVLLGYDTELTYEKLVNCVRLLDMGADYVSTHPDLVCPTENGNEPDVGLVIHSLKVCTGREPVIIGKPQPQMVYSALKKYGAAPEETVLIGDRLYTDIACGNNAGIDTILVLSGEGTVEDCEKYGVKPTYIFRDIADVLAALKEGLL
jgi:HAD superfamily hydrolase (TIGR01450 family)